MRRGPITAVMRKELLEVRRNKMILLSMALLPLVMVSVVVLSALALGSLSVDELKAQGFQPPPGLEHLSPGQAILVIVNDQNLFYLAMTPMLLPVVMGAYSIIGEKETRSLEPLLATPITTTELIAGKALGAMLPALALGWVQVILALIGLALVTSGPVVAEAVRPMWIVAFTVATPLVTLLSTLLAIVVSARMKDARAAQAVAGLVILPVLGIGMAVLVGQIYVDVGVILWACAGLVILDVGAGWLAVRAFERERILARIG